MIKKFLKKASNKQISSPLRYFIHIPKTAGTSFRKSLEKKFNVISDYSPQQPVTSDLVKQYVYQERDIFRFSEELRKVHNVVLSGHMPLRKYAHFAGLENCVTILREPVARMISHYKHQVRHNNCQEDFVTFINRKTNFNTMSQLISLEDLHGIGVVGLTENYPKTLELINAKWNTILKEQNHNIAPSSTDNHLHDLTDFSPYMDQIRELNKKDILLYQSAEVLLKNSISFFERGLPDTRAFLEVNKARSVINGWGFAVGEMSPISVNILINNALVKTCECREFRANLNGRGFPRKGYIGFRINQKLNVGDIIEVLEPSTDIKLFSTTVL